MSDFFNLLLIHSGIYQDFSFRTS